MAALYLNRMTARHHRRHTPKGRHGSRAPQTKRAAPVGEADITVTGLGGHGDGLATFQDQPVFIAQTVPGDRVRVTLYRRVGGGFDGVALELLEASPDRQRPPCGHAGVCGGCVAQHIAGPAYIAWKQAMMVEALGKAGVTPDEIVPLVRIPPRSRRRLSLRARSVQQRGTTSVLLGFNEARSHRVLDVAECVIAQSPLTALLPAVRVALLDALLPGEGATISITQLDDGIDLVVTADRPPGVDARMALADWADTHDLARVSWRIAGTQAEPEPIAHRRAGVLRVGDAIVRVPPGAFLQATVESEDALRRTVLAGLEGTVGPVADLFAGIGTFSLAIARDRPVLAVDSEEPAIAALLAGARSAGIGERVRAETRNLFDRPLAGRDLGGLGAVVFDPPRSGARDQATALADAGPGKVVAVSCRPSSLARDARILLDGGYRLRRITPIDQFLWTAHLELVAVFER